MRLAIVGIRGLPNNYGGFETLADYLVEFLAKDFEITVYCSSTDLPGRQKQYKSANLEYIPITSHGALGILYDSISLLHAVRKNDKILFLGFGAGFVMPYLSPKNRAKIVVNIGGLDWQRNKWSGRAQRVIKRAERLLIENSSQIISDNVGISEYLKNEYNANSELIAYGGDQANKVAITTDGFKDYPFLKNKYAFIVTRIQPDNNIEMLLQAFANQDKMPLVMVGNFENSKFGRYIKELYAGKPYVILLDAIYDRVRLDMLRSNCTIYVHGHSAGGTNPSLAEAMYLSLPVFAYASGYNEHTTVNKALYFKNAEELTELVNTYQKFDLAKIGEDLKAIADEQYRWGKVAQKYKDVILK
jgi:glycosyltransferase involved in cell wall biosynthesis